MIEWALSWVWWARDTVLWAVSGVFNWLVGQARRNPVAVMAMVIAFIRMWGTTVQTGQAGVLFVFGLPRKVLEPGFHPLIPLFQEVRKMPVRSVTIDLPPQRLASKDGLVFDVDATLVMRISDPVKATVEIDDLRAGCITVLTLAVADVIRSKTREELGGRAALDAEIGVRVQHDLHRWGVTVEQAGLNTIAPTRTTTRLSQQQKRIRERAMAMETFLAAGVPLAAALALLGPTQQVVGHAQARYRRRRLQLPVEGPPPVVEALTPMEEELLDEDLGV